MASQSLYRKWRSQTFGDLVGQEPVIKTLKNALSSGKLAHAYLFTGPRGTGKTSTARLLAKTINCENAKDGEPCNVCDQCREITVGNSFNVIEIDAASNRGIDSIRDLREKVMMPPSVGKYKVYILDEAHMLTTEAFNALLKTLEEPPPHAIFVMATTDVHKMLPTVLSRCQRFDFKRITTRQIVAHLQFVAKEEEVTLDKGAAELIARAAAGGMRDALSLLDQSIAYAGQNIFLTQVQAMLGVADPRAIQKFIAHIANQDSAAGLHLINEMTEAGADLRQVNSQTAEYWRAMMLARAGANIIEILDNTQDEINDIVQLAQQFQLDELAECARVFAQNDLVQKAQGTPQLGLELALLACIGIHRRSSGHASNGSVPMSARATPLVQERVQTTSGPAASVVSPLMQGMHPTVPVQSRPGPVAEVPKVPIIAVPVEEKAVPQLMEASSVPSVVSRKITPPPVFSREPDEEEEEPLDFEVARMDTIGDEEEPVVATQSTPLEEVEDVEPLLPETAVVLEEEEMMNNGPDLTVEDVKERWEYVKRRVKTKKDGPKIAAFLNGYVVVGIEGTNEIPIVIIRAIADFHYKSLQKPEYLESINWALKVELDRECKARLLPPGNGNGGGGVTIPPPSQDPGGNLANTMMAISSQQSAYREPPSPPPTKPIMTVGVSKPVASAASTALRSVGVSVQGGRSQVAVQPGKAEVITPVSSAPVVMNQAITPLAINAVVRENTTTVVSVKTQTHQQVIETKAKSDPVVKEVMRIFKAKIKAIQPK